MVTTKRTPVFRQKQRFNKRYAALLNLGSDVQSSFPLNQVTCLLRKPIEQIRKTLRETHDKIVLYSSDDDIDYIDPTAEAICKHFMKKRQLKEEIDANFEKVRTLFTTIDDDPCWLSFEGSEFDCACTSQIKRLISGFKSLITMFENKVYMPMAQFLTVGLDSQTLEVINQILDMVKSAAASASKMKETVSEAFQDLRDLFLVGALVINVGKTLSSKESMAINHMLAIGSCMALAYFHKDNIKTILNEIVDYIGLMTPAQGPQAQGLNVDMKIVHKLLLKLVYGVLAVKTGVHATTIWGFFDKFVLEVSSRYRQTSSLADIVDNLSEIITYGVNFVSRLIYGADVLSLTDNVRTAVDDYADKLRKLDMDLRQGKRALNVITFAEFEELRKLGEKLHYDSTDSVYGRAIASVLREQSNRISDLVTRFNSAFISNGGTRQVPLFLVHLGQTGIGKSVLQALLAKDLTSELPQATQDFYGKCTTDKMMWYFPKSNDHHDGYAGHPMFLIDDFLQQRDSIQNPSKELMAVIDFVNSEPFPMKMADISSKGMMFSSLIGIASTNVTDFDKAIVSIQCVPAVLRRFHFTTLLSVLPEYSKDPGNWNPWDAELDTGKLPFDPDTMAPKTIVDHYSINILDVTKRDEFGRYVILETVTYNEYVQMCRTKFRILRSEYLTRLATLNATTFCDKHEEIPHYTSIDQPGELLDILKVPREGVTSLVGPMVLAKFRQLSKTVKFIRKANGADRYLCTPGMFRIRNGEKFYLLTGSYYLGLLQDVYLDVGERLNFVEEEREISIAKSVFYYIMWHLRYKKCGNSCHIDGVNYTLHNSVETLALKSDCYDPLNMDMEMLTFRVIVRTTDIKRGGSQSVDTFTAIKLVENLTPGALLDVDENIETLYDLDVLEDQVFHTPLAQGFVEDFKQVASKMYNFGFTSNPYSSDSACEPYQVWTMCRERSMIITERMMVELHFAYAKALRHYEKVFKESIPDGAEEFFDSNTMLRAEDVHALAHIFFGSDLYITLLYILNRPELYGERNILTALCPSGIDRERFNSLVIDSRRVFYEKVTRNSGFSVMEPFHIVGDGIFMSICNITSTSHLLPTFSKFSTAMAWFVVAFGFYKMGSYIAHRRQMVNNTSLEAQAATDVKIEVSAVDYPNDKVLSDIKKSTLCKNLFELCSITDDGVRRMCYLLFYKGTRFVTNGHIVSQILKLKAKTPEGIMLLRSFQPNVPDMEISLARIQNLGLVPNSELGMGCLDVVSFPLRPDISTRFVKSARLLKNKFPASWFCFEGGVLRDVSREVRTLQYEAGVNTMVRNLAGDEMTHKYNSEGIMYQSPGGVFYRVERYAGDCGFPLFVDDPSMRSARIFALHAAGSSARIDSYATFVTQEDIEYCDKQLDREQYMTGVSDGVEIPDGHCCVPGFFTEGVFDNKAVQVTKTRITTSKMHGSIGPTPFVLSDLTQPTKSVCKRYSTKTKRATSAKLVATASQSVIKSLCKDNLGNHFKPTKLTFGQAIVGEDLVKLKSINLNTSSGCPYIWNIKGIEGKKTLLGSWSSDDIGSEIMAIRANVYDYIYDHECYSIPALRAEFGISPIKGARYWNLSFVMRIKNLVDDVKKFLHGIQKGVYHPPIYIDYQKDELLKPGKETRIFSAAPLWYTILVRMYVGTFMDWCSANPIGNEIAIGVNPYSEEWDRIWRTILQHDAKCPSDFKEYDTCANSEIMGGFCRELVDVVYKDYSDLDRKTLFFLFYGCCFSKHVFDSYSVVMWLLGMPSGNPLTALMNCWNQLVLFRMCFIIVFGYTSINLFPEAVKLITLGDDGLRSVSKKPWKDGVSMCDKFSPEKVRALMADLGYTITSGDKSIVCTYVKDHEVEFLKRKFIYNDTLARFVAPLNLKSCTKMLYYTKRDDEDISYTNYKKFLLELSFHGRDVYREFSTKLSRVAFERNVDFPVVIPYEDALFENAARQDDVDELLFM